jgi:deoxyribodipyrimidine photolyase-like uncharacterized protein
MPRTARPCGIRKRRCSRTSQGRYGQAQREQIPHRGHHEVDEFFPEDVGQGKNGWLPTTRDASLAALRHVIQERLPLLGDYQDLMLEDSQTMFHSLIAAPLNLGLLLPMECVDAAERAYKSGRAPLAAVEGLGEADHRLARICQWRVLAENAGLPAIQQPRSDAQAALIFL